MAASPSSRIHMSMGSSLLGRGSNMSMRLAPKRKPGDQSAVAQSTSNLQKHFGGLHSAFAARGRMPSAADSLDTVALLEIFSQIVPDHEDRDALVKESDLESVLNSIKVVISNLQRWQTEEKLASRSTLATHFTSDEMQMRGKSKREEVVLFCRLPEVRPGMDDRDLADHQLYVNWMRLWSLRLSASKAAVGVLVVIYDQGRKPSDFKPLIVENYRFYKEMNPLGTHPVRTIVVAANKASYLLLKVVFKTLPEEVQLSVELLASRSALTVQLANSVAVPGYFSNSGDRYAACYYSAGDFPHLIEKKGFAPIKPEEIFHSGGDKKKFTRDRMVTIQWEAKNNGRPSAPPSKAEMRAIGESMGSLPSMGSIL